MGIFDKLMDTMHLGNDYEDDYEDEDGYYDDYESEENVSDESGLEE